MAGSKPEEILIGIPETFRNNRKIKFTVPYLQKVHIKQNSFLIRKAPLR